MLSGDKKFALKTVSLPENGARFKLFYFPLDFYLDKQKEKKASNDYFYRIFSKS